MISQIENCVSMFDIKAPYNQRNKFNPNTDIPVNNPGNATIHHELLKIYALPSFRILPQLGIGAGTPAPRKLNAASAIMADANVNVICTITGARIFGAMCFQRILLCLAPRHFIASIYVCSLTTNADDLAILATPGTLTMDKLMITFLMSAPNTAINVIAIRIFGTARKPSQILISTLSRTLLVLAYKPIIMPNTAEQIPTEKPTTIDTLAP